MIVRQGQGFLVEQRFRCYSVTLLPTVTLNKHCESSCELLRITVPSLYIPYSKYYLECTWTEHYTFFVQCTWTEHQILFGMYKDGTLYMIILDIKETDSERHLTNLLETLSSARTST